MKPVDIAVDLKTAREIRHMLNCSCCGHASPPMTDKARRVWKRMAAADFNVRFVSTKQKKGKS